MTLNLASAREQGFEPRREDRGIDVIGHSGRAGRIGVSDIDHTVAINTLELAESRVSAQVIARYGQKVVSSLRGTGDSPN